MGNITLSGKPLDGLGQVLSCPVGGEFGAQIIGDEVQYAVGKELQL